MMTRTASIALVALSLVAVPVAAVGAEPSNSELIMMGVGTRSCEEFLGAYQSDPEVVEFAFCLGRRVICRRQTMR